MSLLSKFRTLGIGLRVGRVTLPYPVAPRPAPERFRGRPIFDGSKCIGCAGCANNCPAREILISDLTQETRVVKYLGLRCTYCGRCADVCPEGAITLSRDFETATDDVRDLQQTLEIFMGTCQRCGRCFKGPGLLEQLKLKGYRHDDLEADRWIYASQAYLDGAPTVGDIELELD
jgi:hydrogenase-4 component H